MWGAITGKKLTTRRFYLVATQRRRGARLGGAAVSGECELITAEFDAASESDSPHVAAGFRTMAK